MNTDTSEAVMHDVQERAASDPKKQGIKMSAAPAGSMPGKVKQSSDFCVSVLNLSYTVVTESSAVVPENHKEQKGLKNEY